MPRLLAAVVLSFVVGCGSSEPPPVAEPTWTVATPAPAAPAIAREQLFFSGRSDDGPVLAALVLQREPRPRGAVVETKGFVVVDGTLRTPFFERTELGSWPGEEVGPALDAWRAARVGEPLRMSWSDGGGRLTTSIRSASRTLTMHFEALAPAGEGTGPHGPLSWQAGRATLSLDGQEFRGVGVVERLRGDVARPAFGRFEMWLLAPQAGRLVLGRKTFGASGSALRVDPVGQASTGPFDVEIVGARAHEPTGWELPVAWRLPEDGALELRRAESGAPVTGQSADGGTAVYDIGPASSAGGGAAALVFHLQDE